MRATQLPREVLNSIIRQRNQVIVKPYSPHFAEKEIRLQDEKARALLEEAIQPIILH